MIPVLSLSLILLPLLGATLFLIGAIPAFFRGRRITVLAVLITLVTLGVALALICLAYPQMPMQMTLGKMPWIGGNADLFGALLDPLSLLMLLVVCVIGTFVVLFSTRYVDPENKEHPGEKRRAGYFAWLLLFIGSMIGIAISPNLLQFLIFWELTTICSAALIAFYETEKGFRAGFKALLMTHAPGLFFFVAVAILFVSTKSFNFEAIGTLAPAMKTTVIAFLIIAAWAKSAQFPFFTWLPDAMEAPTPVSAYLHAAAMVKAGVFLFARIVTSVSGISSGLGIMVVCMAVLTMYIGLLYYFRQDDLKKLLAYSTITHLAYMFLGLGLGILGSSTGLKGGLLHLICHAFGKTLLFLCVGAIGYLTGTRSISKLSGLYRRMPVVAFSFLVGVFTVTGIPPFACFFSKFFILVGAMELKSSWGTVLAVLIMAESIGSFYWFLKVAQKVFFGESEEKEPIPVPAIFQWTLLLLVVFSLLAPWFGLTLLEGTGIKI